MCLKAQCLLIVVVYTVAWWFVEVQSIMVQQK